MKNQKALVTAVVILVGICLGLVAYILTSKPAAPTDNFEKWAQEKQKEQSKKRSGPAEEDPYIKGAVKNTIIKNAKEIQTCYLELLKSDKKASGKIKIQWSILIDGKTKKPETVISDFNNTAFATCLENKISSLEFPPPPNDNYYIEHTFLFKPEEKKAE